MRIRLIVTAVALMLYGSVQSLIVPTGLVNSDRCRTKSCVLYSSIGDGGDDSPPSGRNKDSQGWEDFLNRNEKESDNLLRAREYFSDRSLPLSYDYRNNDANISDIGDNTEEEINEKESNSSALTTSGMQVTPFAGGITQDAILRNPYLAVVTKLSPSDIISKFTSTAHPGVQNAVRSTILGLIGGLPKMAFETTTVTTGQKLASLMFQLQMTGYMFKNAEYRLSVRQSLDDEFLESSTKGGKIKGKIRVRYGGGGEIETKTSAGGLEMEVDAAAYMSELRAEVSRLRDELMTTRKEKADIVRKDLLMYIRTLPPRELQSLTNTMSQDVLIAMKGLVNAVIAGIGDGQIGPDTVTEQSAEAMAQLCMWQLALGYNLRTLEVREEMKKALIGGNDSISAGQMDSDSLQ